MDKIEEIRAKIGECDDIIIKQLAGQNVTHSGDYIIQEGNRNPNLTAGAGESRQMHLWQSLATMNLRKRYLIFSSIS